ncbi:MAG: hypothetical protein IT371_10285 [Deltaproteobacteria bacterium]|nr:hypothetical protein [Deltaproteobacteria bacterium]
MSRRCLTLSLLGLLSASAATALLFTLCLPLLVSLPAASWTGVPLWGVLSPMAAGLAGAAVLLAGHRGLRRGVRAEHLGNLPGQVVLAFGVAATTTLFLGALIERDALLRHRPLGIFLSGPALVLSVTTLLRPILRVPLVAEMNRLLATSRRPRRAEADGSPSSAAPEPAPSTSRGLFRRSSLAVLAITPALTVSALALAGVSWTLIGVHSYYHVLSNEEQMARGHLSTLLHTVQVQLQRLPHAKHRGFVETLPAARQGQVVLLDEDGRVLSRRSGLDPRIPLEQRGERCRQAEQQWRCAVEPAPGNRRIAALQAPSLPDAEVAATDIGPALVLLALGFLLFAGMLGRAVGQDASRDFRTVTQQLYAMAREDQPDLGRPLAVTSLDEVGELVAAVGKLRTRLGAELEAYRDSVRKTAEAERMKNQFLSDVSHELRTPLNSLCGHAQLLLEGIEGPLSTAQREDIRSISKGGQQLLALMTDVLDLSVIESGKLTLKTEKVDLARLCRDIAEGQRSVLRAAAKEGPPKVQLELDLAEELPEVVADPRRIQQVLLNLVSNAIKFTTEGSVTLRARREGPDLVRLEVEDTGTGIGATDLPRVFEEYRQAGTLRSKRKGTGLGLAICRRLVELHGGQISAESEIDRGSRFTVLLRVAGPPLAASSRPGGGSDPRGSRPEGSTPGGSAP